MLAVSCETLGVSLSDLLGAPAASPAAAPDAYNDSPGSISAYEDEDTYDEYDPDNWDEEDIRDTRRLLRQLAGDRRLRRSYANEDPEFVAVLYYILSEYENSGLVQSLKRDKQYQTLLDWSRESYAALPEDDKDAAGIASPQTGPGPAPKPGAKPAYAEEGGASYYADSLHGNKTASGEPYDRNALTAAHKTLAFGTRVKVTFPATGKSVIVRINDRGPFVSGRIIDLSRAAANAIGLIPYGHGQVGIEIVEGGASTPAVSTPQPAPTPQPTPTPQTPAPAPQTPAPSGSSSAVRNGIVNAAKKYLGASYVYGAMQPNSKFDCSGLVGQAYKDAANITVPRSSADIWTRGKAVNKNDLQPGDIIVFNTTGSGASHVAIYMDGGQMIHAASAGSPTGVIISQQNESYWAQRVMGYRTFVGVSMTKTSALSASRMTITDFPVEISGNLRRVTEALPVLAGTALRFMVSNRTGADGEFTLNFYKVGASGANAQTETLTVQNGNDVTSAASGICICAETGQYRLEITKGGKTLAEYTFNAVK
jgi:rare lipoprotein A